MACAMLPAPRKAILLKATGLVCSTEVDDDLRSKASELVLGKNVPLLDDSELMQRPCFSPPVLADTSTNLCIVIVDPVLLIILLPDRFCEPRPSACHRRFAFPKPKRMPTVQHIFIVNV